MAKAQGKLGANGAEVYLTVDVLEPQKEGDQWSAKMTVHVGLKGHQNWADCQLTLFLDGRDLGIDAQTNDQGLYPYEVDLPGPGSYLIGAAIRGTSIMAVERRRVVIEKLTTKIPCDLRVVPSGKFGKQQLLISLEAEDSSRVGNYSGKMMVGGNWLDIKTGPDGTLIHKMDFNDEELAIRIQFGNEPELRWSAALPGPRRTP